MFHHHYSSILEDSPYFLSTLISLTPEVPVCIPTCISAFLTVCLFLYLWICLTRYRQYSWNGWQVSSTVSYNFNELFLPTNDAGDILIILIDGDWPIAHLLSWPTSQSHPWAMAVIVLMELKSLHILEGVTMYAALPTVGRKRGEGEMVSETW